MDYRIYCLITLLGWGFWGFGSKLLGKFIQPFPLSFFSNVGTVLFLSLFLFKFSLPFNKFSLYALINGLIAGVGTFGFYFALNKGEASVVFPLTSLYIIFPVILGYLFLKEPITFKHFLGFIFSLIAIYLLSS